MSTMNNSQAGQLTTTGKFLWPEVCDTSCSGDPQDCYDMREMLQVLDDPLTFASRHTLHQHQPFDWWYSPKPTAQSKPLKEWQEKQVLEPLSPVSSSNSSIKFDFELDDLHGFLLECAKDQYGSRFLQQKIAESHDDSKQRAFNELRPHIIQLTCHVFGNYVIQKYLEFGSNEQRRVILEMFCGRWAKFALDLYGCRVVQKAIEILPALYQAVIINELAGRMIECVMHQNGNHVVQKCVVMVPHELLSIIIDAFVGQMYVLSIHPYGCRVMQRILEHCNRAQLDIVLREILQHTESLVLNQYGNYVIQHVMEHGRGQDMGRIIIALAGKICSLSQHKFASNVIEKCLTYGSTVDRTRIIEEITQDSTLLTMMLNQYGNYVIQKAIDTAEPLLKHELITKIHPYIPVMRRYNYARHIVSKVNNLLSKASFAQW